MGDPSQGVHRDLLPHVHLLCTHRLPSSQQLHFEKAAHWLREAPNIARNQASFHWTFLDQPPSGSVFLVWQSPLIGSEFPSDGYIWAPGETGLQNQVLGGDYTIELYNAKAGFVQGDQYTTHSRCRYRLIPQTSASNPNNPNQNFWIVHYYQAAAEDRVPTSVIPVDLRVQQMLSARAYLKAQGQIVQKEFVLYDRGSWPQIPIPRGQARASIYGGNMPPTRIPQGMAYATQGSMSGPPQKRARTDEGAVMQMPPGAHLIPPIEEDDEDTFRGDYWDHVTPHEITESRYKHNYDLIWEVVGSQYPMSRIAPRDLGLGMKGELSRLTEGIFHASTGLTDAPAPEDAYIGRLEPGKADEFRKRVVEHVETTNKEVEKIKAKHAKRLARFNKNRMINVAAQELRFAIDNPSDTGSENWDLEGIIKSNANGDEKAPAKAPAIVDDIVAQVEASLDCHTTEIKKLQRIQNGGYEETVNPSPEMSRQPSQAASHKCGSGGSGILIGDADIDMGGSAANLLDQFHTGLSSNPTPGSNMQTPQAHLSGLSAAGTPANINTPSPRVSAPQPPTNIAEQQHHSEDVNMGEAPTQQQPQQPTSATGSSMSIPGSDWVVVPPGGISPPNSAIPQRTTATQSMLSITAPTTSTSLPDLPVPTSTAPPTNDTLPDFKSTSTPGAVPPMNENDFSDLADLDTAGEAIASFGGAADSPILPPPLNNTTQQDTATTENKLAEQATADDGGLGDLDLQMEGVGDLEIEDMDVGDMGMGEGDESAFGEAFVGMGGDEGGN